MSLEVFNDKLWIAGGFDVTGSDTGALNVAIWDGHHWDGNMPGRLGIYDFEIFNDSILYIGGNFNTAPNCDSGRGISRWNGMGWNDFTYGIQLNAYIYSLCSYKNKLYAAGYFSTMSGVPCHDIASWNGTSWDDVDEGPGSNEISALIEYNDELIAGGRLGHLPDYYLVARWNDTSWKALGIFGLMGNPSPGDVYALAVDTLRNLLYAAGTFIWADGMRGYYIAQWDGRRWTFINYNPIYIYRLSLYMYHNDLYISGFAPYLLPNGDSVAGVMKWNGAEWTGVGARFTRSDLVSGCSGKFINYHDTLYFGGKCDFMYDTVPIHNIARMYSPPDTSCENLLGNYNRIWAQDVTYFCDDAIVNLDNNTLYYADNWLWDFGDGTSATLPAPQHIYDSAGIYDVSLITTYKNCIDTAYKTLAVFPCDSLHINISGHPDTMYLADDGHGNWVTWATFHVTANSTMADFFYYWNTGNGRQDSGYYVTHDALFLNPYSWYYDEPGTYIITLVVKQDCCYDTIYDTLTVIDPNAGITETSGALEYLGQNIPNPFNNSTLVPYNVPPGSTGSIFISDMKGTLIQEYKLKQGKNELEVSLKNFASGAYFYSIKIDGQVKQTRRMILSD